jgi:hypothetical protein
MQEKLYEASAVHISRVSEENLSNFAERDQVIVNDHFHMGRAPDDIQIFVAGGPGKHSAFIPTFGFTEVCSERLPSR